MKRALTLILLLAVALSLPTAFADEDAAEYFTDRGNQALEKEDWEEAEQQFSKALSEWKTHAPAVLGLAKVARGRKDDKQAIGYLVTCIKLRDSVGGSEAGKKAIEEAEALLKKLDRPRFEYGKLVDAYVVKLKKLATASAKDSPDLARRCVDRILSVAPADAEAQAMKEDLGSAPKSPGRKSTRGETLLFNGENLDNFFGVNDKWKVEDGKIVIRTQDEAFIIRTHESAKGDYTLTMEMRMTEDSGADPLVSLSFGYRGQYERYNLNVFNDAIQFRAMLGTAKNTEVFGRTENYLIAGYDRKKWSTYQVKVKGDRAKILVNGKTMWTKSGDEGAFDGPIAIVVQDCSAEIRKLSLSK